VNYLKNIHKSFALTTEEQWNHLTQSSVKEIGDGKYGLRYDPAIGTVFKNISFKDIMLWPLWDQIKCPVMLIRGKESTLLSSATVEEMKIRGPGLAALLVVENVGHAPSLMDPHHVDPIKEFLLKGFVENVRTQVVGESSFLSKARLLAGSINPSLAHLVEPILNIVGFHTSNATNVRAWADLHPKAAV